MTDTQIKTIEKILLGVHDKDCYRGAACGHIEDGVAEITELIQKARSQERNTVLQEIEEASEKELSTQMERATETQDIEKAQLAGYASGVISRLIQSLRENR